MALPRSRIQTLVIFIVCVLIVLAVGLYSGTFSGYSNDMNSQAVYSNKNIATSSVYAGDIVDAAHASDWKKAFFDTSSSTGTFKDVSKSADGSQNTPSTATSGPLTETDILGRNFLTGYAKLRQAGLEKDADSVNSLTQQLVTDSLANVSSPESFSSSNINISYSNDTKSLQTYANTLSALVKSDISIDNEAIVAKNAFDSGDMSLLKEIDPIITGYESALKDMKTMSVPSSLAQPHLSLMNSISVQLFNAKALRHVDTNPVLGLAAIGQEVAGLQGMNDSLVDIQNSLTKSGITFEY